MQKLLKRAYIEVQKHEASGKAECEKSILKEISKSYDKIVAAALNKQSQASEAGKEERKTGKGKDKVALRKVQGVQGRCPHVPLRLRCTCKQ